MNSFASFFAAAGIAALVADPNELAWDGKTLACRGQPVDLVSNPLTDFDLDKAANTPLRAAYPWPTGGADAPHPRAHALRRQAQPDAPLRPDGIALAAGRPRHRETLLAGIPRTVAVTAADGERASGRINRWFFKPAAGLRQPCRLPGRQS